MILWQWLELLMLVGPQTGADDQAEPGFRIFHPRNPRELHV